MDSLESQTLDFDPAGDIFLLLETTGDRGSYEKASSSISEAPRERAPVQHATVDNVPANDAHTDDTPQDDPILAAQHTKARETSLLGEAEDFSLKENKCLVKMRVSSKHLGLASSVFDDMIKNGTRDDLPQDSPVEIPIKNDHFDTLQILLNVVHGFYSKVPKRVNINTLGQALVLIDKYEFHEINALFPHMWYTGLKPTLPRGPCDNLAFWIYICLELKQSADYEAMTKIAIFETDCAFQSTEVARIPYWIIDDMRSRRQDILSAIFSTLSKMVEKYAGSDQICRQDDDCDALSLGKLIKGLKTAGLYPLPEAVVCKTSIKDLLSLVRNVDLTNVCYGCHKKRYTPSRHIGEELRDLLSSIASRIEGMKISGNCPQKDG